MYTLNRAPGIAIPGLDQIRPIQHDYSGIERGLGAFGKGLASYLEEKQLRDALEEANNPKIEQLQRERAATQDELQRAQAETDQVLKSEAYDFVYDTPNPTPDMITPEREAEVQSYLDFAKNQAPEQKKRGLEPAAYVDAQAPVQESYYKVGNMEFSAPPDQQALDVIINQGKAKAVEAQDPRLAMDYEQKAKQALAQKLKQTYLQLERTEDVPGAVRLHSNIPDGMTTVERQLPDGTWEVYLHPDGRPDEAQLFARGTAKDVFSAIRRSVDPDAFDRAAELQYNRGRQEQADQRAAQQEARYADNAQRQEARYQRQELLSRAELLENAAKERAVVGDIEGAANMKRQADALRQQVFSQPSAGGLGGPVTGQGGFDAAQYGTSGGASERQIANVMQYKTIIDQAGAMAGVDPLLITAVAAVESAGNARARSPKDAQGVMQLIPATAQRFGVTDPYNPAENVYGGAKYLAWLLNRFDGNLEHALAGYNAGEGRVDQYNGVPPFAETRAYVPKVLATYAALKQQYGGEQPAPQQGLGGPVGQQLSSPGLATPSNQPQQGLVAQADDYARKWAKMAAAPKMQGRQLTPEQALSLEQEAIARAQNRGFNFDQLSPDAQGKLLAEARQEIRDEIAAWNNGGQAGATAATMTQEQRMKMFTDNLDKIIEVLRAKQSK